MKFERRTDDIIKYVIIMSDCSEKEELENNIIKKITNKKDLTFNIIKYGKGIEWSEWQECNTIDKDFKLYKHLQEKLRPYGILYYKLNKSKYNKDNKNEMLFDYNIIIYKKGDIIGYQYKILCVINDVKLYILNIKLIGTLNEEYINPDLEEELIQDLTDFTVCNQLDMYSYDEFDDAKAFMSEDSKVTSIIYNNLMDYNKCNKEDDYIKNIEYTKIQNEMRNKFINGMLNECDDIMSNNIYKNYPIKNDFIIK